MKRVLVVQHEPFEGPGTLLEALRTVRQTIRDVRVAEVVKQDIHLEENGEVTYRSKLQISFKYESDR